MLRSRRRPTQSGTIFLCPEGLNHQLSVGCRFPFFYLFVCSPFFNLFAKEIKAQRAWRLIKVDILTLRLIALQKSLTSRFTADGEPIFKSNFNTLGYNGTKELLSVSFWQWSSPSPHTILVCCQT
jgi:hypothetical protein